MPTARIQQITIVGTGLIGGSFALALKKHGFAGRVVGCDREPVLARARAAGVIDKGIADPEQAADELLSFLRSRGYLEPDDQPDGP